MDVLDCSSSVILFGFEKDGQVSKGWFSVAIMTLWKSKIRVVSGVISSTESKSEESERFHFFRLRLRLRRLRSAYDLVKTTLSESEAEVEG